MSTAGGSAQPYIGAGKGEGAAWAAQAGLGQRPGRGSSRVSGMGAAGSRLSTTVESGGLAGRLAAQRGAREGWFRQNQGRHGGLVGEGRAGLGAWPASWLAAYGAAPRQGAGRGQVRDEVRGTTVNRGKFQGLAVN